MKNCCYKKKIAQIHNDPVTQPLCPLCYLLQTITFLASQALTLTNKIS